LHNPESKDLEWEWREVGVAACLPAKPLYFTLEHMHIMYCNASLVNSRWPAIRTFTQQSYTATEV